MRRQAKVWAGAFSPEKGSFPGVQAFRRAEDGTEAALKGRVAEGPGGVFESGTQQEDGPVTWEALSASSSEHGVGTGGKRNP